MVIKILPAIILQLSAYSAVGADAKKIKVLAAASLVDVLPKISAAYQKSGGEEVVFSFDATSRLAAQIKAGAPADIFVSADAEWMEELAKDKLVDTSSCYTVAKNTLVLIASKKTKLPTAPKEGFPFERLEKMALAGENVPAGKYAEAGLKFFVAWDKLKKSIIRGDNVRTVLTWVASNEVPYGVVYNTDALTASDKVSAVFTFPETSHPPIVYPAALVARGDQKTAGKFLNFLKSPSARQTFKDAGFGAGD